MLDFVATAPRAREQRVAQAGAAEGGRALSRRIAGTDDFIRQRFTLPLIAALRCVPQGNGQFAPHGPAVTGARVLAAHTADP